MIKSKYEMNQKQEIYLNGPEGNAFWLLSYAKNTNKELQRHEVQTIEEGEQILKDMQSSDYENLITIFDEKYGSFYQLYR